MTEQIKHSILVVEDERPLLEAIKSKLEKNDLQVLTARSVEQALTYINDSVEVDAIWLDHYLLGKETGLDLVAKIKEDNRYKQAPIFVVSNTATPDKEKAYKQLGVNKYFIKADNRIETIVQEIKEYL